MKKLTVFMLCATALGTTAIATPKKTQAINDAWYVMQAGSTPWGYFHEVIELRDGHYSYRYNMTKVENGGLYHEDIGALSQQDLTPIAFNLNKSGAGATETTNATYSKDQYGGKFQVVTTGARAASFARHTSNDTILDVFFPVWLSQHWDKMKAGYKGSVQTFAEDPQKADYRPRMVRFEAQGMDTNAGCMKFHITIDTDDTKVEWCMSKSGALEEFRGPGYHVKKVSGESEAKKFLSGVLPKAGKKKEGEE